MHSLIITANPNPKGSTNRIAESYAKGVKKQKGTFEIIDLYKTDFKKGFLTFGAGRSWPSQKMIKPYQTKVKNADEIVLCYPTWWGDCPAIMRNFFDSTMQGGFSHLKTKNGAKPLLKGKSAKIFTTMDAPKIYYWLMGNPAKKLWKIRFGFTGIKLKDYKIFDRKSQRKASEFRDWLKEVKESAEK